MAGSFGGVVADVGCRSRTRWSERVSRVKSNQWGMSWIEGILQVGEVFW